MGKNKHKKDKKKSFLKSGGLNKKGKRNAKITLAIVLTISIPLFIFLMFV